MIPPRRQNYPAVGILDFEGNFCPVEGDVIMHVCAGYDDNDNDGENDWYVDDVDYDRNIDMIMSIAHTGHSHHACVWRAFLQRMHVCHCKSQIRRIPSKVGDNT